MLSNAKLEQRERAGKSENIRREGYLGFPPFSSGSINVFLLAPFHFVHISGSLFISHLPPVLVMLLGITSV